MTHTDPQHGRGVSRSDPARALDEIAAQQRLLRSVTALEEPLRSTLLRRHHHGLTVEEIAHADGVPPATVRARLRVMVKTLLKRYKYPPDKQDQATETVLKQAETLSEQWASG